MENISLNYSASDFVQLAFRRCIRVWKFPFMRENMGEILSLELLKFFKGERSLSSYAFLALMHSDTSINTRDTTALDLSFSSVVVHVFHERGIAGHMQLAYIVLASPYARACSFSCIRFFTAYLPLIAVSNLQSYSDHFLELL